jgi:peptide/nickel transport system substrate-binding protein
MKKIVFQLLVASVLLGSCTKDNEAGNDPEALVEIKGGKYQGGIFKYNESEYFKNLFPHSITDASSYRIANQVYEGLMKFTQDSLHLIPSLAESYTVSEDGKVYTFKLRNNVYFHDNECFEGGKGRLFTAEDVKNSFTQLCTFNPSENQGFSMFENILVGANEYFASTKNGKPSGEVTGIKVIDKNTIEFTLIEANSIFLYNLARPFTYIFPKEAYAKYGKEMRTNAVGTGPFQISSIDPNSTVVYLKRNTNYYLKDKEGNVLPYLNGIKIQFLTDRKTELTEFKKGTFHMMYRLPTDYIIQIEEESIEKKGEYGMYDLQKNPEMAVHFLSFANQGTLFNNVNLRKALSFAIDRKKILEKVLDGEGDAPGYWGITPINVFPNYPAKTKVKGYDLNLDSAKYYLNKAGYKSGANLPIIKLELNSDGERNINVAEEVKKQLLDNLNVRIELNIVNTPTLVENMIQGKNDFFRVGWIADYPSPENFLWYFYGKNVPADKSQPSYPNFGRYSNPKFDAEYELGLKAKTETEAYEHFAKAEAIAMADAPIMVLWYDEAYRLMQPNVKNFPNNPMQYRDFSAVYLTPVQNTKK